MINPVLILTKNNLELTKRCVASCLEQDVTPAAVSHLYDNDSTDGTQRWLDQTQDDPRIVDQSSGVDLGVSGGWNFVLDILFNNWNTEHVLCVGNDTVLPPFLYSQLLSYPQPFVTGFAVENMEELRMPTVRRTEPHPDFSCFLIRRECWEKVGEFEESMFLYASDCDYHVRGHRAGIEMVKVPVPFFHQRSSTMRLAPPEERSKINKQANEDRAVFYEKYKCLPGSAEYSALFAP